MKSKFLRHIFLLSFTFLWSFYFFLMQAFDKRVAIFTTKHSLNDIQAPSGAENFAIRFKSIKKDFMALLIKNKKAQQKRFYHWLFLIRNLSEIFREKMSLNCASRKSNCLIILNWCSNLILHMIRLQTYLGFFLYA